MEHSLDEIAAGYWQYLETKDQQYFWAWLEVDDMCHNLYDGLKVTQKLLEEAPTKFARECAAAHALEDLVVRHGVAGVREIGRLSEGSKPLRQSLSVIDVDEDGEVYGAWVSLLSERAES